MVTFMDNDACSTTKKNVYMYTTREQREKLLYAIKWNYFPFRDENDKIIPNTRPLTPNDVRLGQLAESLEKSLSDDKYSVCFRYKINDFETLLAALQPIFGTVRLNGLSDLYTALRLL